MSSGLKEFTSLGFRKQAGGKNVSAFALHATASKAKIIRNKITNI
jgi:hypothetical protein